MAVKVVDASALGALLFGEPEGTASICHKKMRRYPAMRNELLAAFDLLARTTIDIVDVDHGEVLRLAESSGLTVYDASYLWLSRHLGAELVTLDRQLEAAR
jgi:predicted nucleic acid-binding protein